MFKLLLILVVSGGALFLLVTVGAVLLSWMALKALFIVSALVGGAIGLSVTDSSWGALAGAVLGVGAGTLLLLALDDGR